ncbi:MAG: Mrp/NBP35 family ATP-binding protein [Candidatus Dadabacteria bacterium]|nr:Mrp/NBP35 family ATP-binding protein [Candidatus Dadabacteria bacterium]MDE0291306.1 Mrp/NBP35 family ATP-binding protein [Candidatus Dadabacteria bacterium]MDE0477490.1 Mrp/NBP35 family ATP-binding protein [Candidatus Dadabacteria bacterium]
MELNRERIIKVLKGVNYPGFNRDIVSFGLVKDILVEDSKVTLSIVLPKPDQKLQSTIEEEVRKAIFGIPGVEDLSMKIGSRPQKQITADADSEKSKLPDIKYYIAVASGKGGVGKSTIATNLSLAISKKRQKVGLMDADIWGPSAPLMMGISEKPRATADDKIVPIEKFGLKVMSIGFLVNEEDAVIWRGPMVHGAIKQFIEDVEWSGTDYLVIDLPPGTGDAQLSLAQTAPISGGVIVTTPQDVALVDVRRGILMFNKLNIPILGIVENMSYLDMPDVNGKIDIFGRGGGRRMAEKFEVPFLGEIPIDPRIRIGGDNGTPIVESDPQSAAGKAFFEIADRILESIEN